MSDYTYIHRDIVDSTNHLALEMINAGEISGPAVIRADIQTKGRGRNGRSWVSMQGNLLASFILMPEGEMRLCPYIIALAVHKMLEGFGAPDLSLKWPNDVLIGGRKCAGILCESARHAGRRYLIAGVGLNITHCPDEVMFPATCLYEHLPGTVNAEDICKLLVRDIFHMQEIYENYGAQHILRLWDAAAPWMRNREVNLGEHNGRYIRLEDDGAILMHRSSDNREITLYAGDIEEA